MRWIWIDRFEEFESGRKAVAVKHVSMAEEHLHDHFPGFPVMPASLLIEGMAQTAGVLIGEARNFTEKVVLAKIKRAMFLRIVRPGTMLRYVAEIEHLTQQAASTTGRIVCPNGVTGDELIGEVDLVFSHVDQNMSGLEFPEENFVFTDDFLSLLSTFRDRCPRTVPL